jgi:hypothetical protein
MWWKGGEGQEGVGRWSSGRAGGRPGGGRRQRIPLSPPPWYILRTTRALVVDRNAGGDQQGAEPAGHLAAGREPPAEAPPAILAPLRRARGADCNQSGERARGGGNVFLCACRRANQRRHRRRAQKADSYAGAGSCTQVPARSPHACMPCARKTRFKLRPSPSRGSTRRDHGKRRPRPVAAAGRRASGRPSPPQPRPPPSGSGGPPLTKLLCSREERLRQQQEGNGGQQRRRGAWPSGPARPPSGGRRGHQPALEHSCAARGRALRHCREGAVRGAWRVNRTGGWRADAPSGDGPVAARVRASDSSASVPSDTPKGRRTTSRSRFAGPNGKWVTVLGQIRARIVSTCHNTGNRRG